MDRGLLVPAAVVVAAVLGYAVGADAFRSPPTPAPEVEELAVYERGCRGDVDRFGRTRTGPEGNHVFAGTLDTASPATDLSARALRTSPSGASVLTYRVDLTTRDPAGSSRCPGRIAYRVIVDAPDGPGGARVALFVDGRVAACSAAVDGGVDSRCGALLRYGDAPTVSTNRSVTG